MRSEPPRCSVCGAIRSRSAGMRANICWLCEQPYAIAMPVAGADKALIVAEMVAEAADPENPFAPPATVLNEPIFALSTILLFLMLAIVCVGTAVAAPGVGIPLAFLVAPALIRSVVQIRRRRMSGAQVTGGEKAIVFFTALAAVLIAATAAGVAFFVTCIATCFGYVAVRGTRGSSVSGLHEEQLFTLAIFAGGVTGILAGGAVLHAFWKSTLQR